MKEKNVVKKDSEMVRWLMDLEWELKKMKEAIKGMEDTITNYRLCLALVVEKNGCNTKGKRKPKRVSK